MKDRYNIISSRKVTLRIKVLAKRQEIDRMTISELKTLKKQLQSNLNNITVNDLAKPIFQKIDRKLKTVVDLYER